MANKGAIAVLAGRAYPTRPQCTAILLLLVVPQRIEANLATCAYVVLVAYAHLVDVVGWSNREHTAVKTWYLTIFLRKN